MQTPLSGKPQCGLPTAVLCPAPLAKPPHPLVGLRKSFPGQMELCSCARLVTFTDQASPCQPTVTVRSGPVKPVRTSETVCIWSPHLKKGGNFSLYKPRPHLSGTHFRLLLQTVSLVCCFTGIRFLPFPPPHWGLPPALDWCQGPFVDTTGLAFPLTGPPRHSLAISSWP